MKGNKISLNKNYINKKNYIKIKNIYIKNFISEINFSFIYHINYKILHICGYYNNINYCINIFFIL